MNKTTNIMIVGVGGQGTLLASRILGNAVIRMGYDVKVSEVHGMSQRGGSVVTYVKYGEKVYSPVVELGEADVIISFEQLECARWLPYLKKGGKLVTYTVVESPVAGYATSGGTVDADAGDDFELSVTNTHQSASINLTAAKVWDDNGNQDGKRPATVTYTLQSKVGTADWAKSSVAGATQVVSVATDAAGAAPYTWNSLRAYQGGRQVHYRVVEERASGYE